jgi:hypothetical protein
MVENQVINLLKPCFDGLKPQLVFQSLNLGTLILVAD